MDPTGRFTKTLLTDTRESYRNAEQQLKDNLEQFNQSLRDANLAVDVGTLSNVANKSDIV
jgi:hypothetical protein